METREQNSFAPQAELEEIARSHGVVVAERLVAFKELEEEAENSATEKD